MGSSKWGVHVVVGLAGIALVVACSGGSADGSDGDGPGCTESLPPGTFARSCDGCLMNGTVLSCTGCSDGAGGDPGAQLDTCSCASAESTSTISNNNGVLTCGTGASSGGGGDRPECTSDSSCSGRCATCRSGRCHQGQFSYVKNRCLY